MNGSAMAQAIRRLPLSTQAWVQSCSSPHEIRDGPGIHYFSVEICLITGSLTCTSYTGPGKNNQYTTSCRLDRLGFKSQQWREIFFPQRPSRMALRPTQPTVHSLPVSAKVKNEWSYTSTPPICLHDLDRGNFTFTHFCVLYFQIMAVSCFSSIYH
jgi:hypothetical protein